RPRRHPIRPRLWRRARRDRGGLRRAVRPDRGSARHRRAGARRRDRRLARPLAVPSRLRRGAGGTGGGRRARHRRPACPARSGVTSALLVRAGWTGIDDIFSGPDNFLLAHGRSADAAVLIDKLGERYEVMRTNIKKWSVGSPIQAALDALELLLQRRPFT